MIERVFAEFYAQNTSAVAPGWQNGQTSSTVLLAQWFIRVSEAGNWGPEKRRVTNIARSIYVCRMRGRLMGIIAEEKNARGFRGWRSEGIYPAL